MDWGRMGKETFRSIAADAVASLSSRRAIAWAARHDRCGESAFNARNRRVPLRSSGEPPGASGSSRHTSAAE